MWMVAHWAHGMRSAPRRSQRMRRSDLPESASCRLLCVEVARSDLHERLVGAELDTRGIPAAGDEFALLLQHPTLHNDAAVARDQVFLRVQRDGSLPHLCLVVTRRALVVFLRH